MADPVRKIYLLTWLHTDGDGVPMAESRALRLSEPERKKLRKFMGRAVKGGNTSDVGCDEAKLVTFKEFLAEAKEEGLFV